TKVRLHVSASLMVENNVLLGTTQLLREPAPSITVLHRAARQRVRRLELRKLCGHVSPAGPKQPDNPVPLRLHCHPPQIGVVRLPAQPAAKLRQTAQGSRRPDLLNLRNARNLRNPRMKKILANAHDDDAMPRLRDPVLLAPDQECSRVPLNQGRSSLLVLLDVNREEHVALPLS